MQNLAFCVKRCRGDAHLLDGCVIELAPRLDQHVFHVVRVAREIGDGLPHALQNPLDRACVLRLGLVHCLSEPHRNARVVEPPGCLTRLSKFGR